MMRSIAAIVAALICAGLIWRFSNGDAKASSPADAPPPAGFATAVFAGGCFWCVESDFDKLDGVVDVVSGYTGGLLENPTYENHEGHVEAVKVTYDPKIVNYRALVDYHLRHIDPLDDGGQFCDRGYAYTTAIYAADADEWAAATAAIESAEKMLGEKIVTPVRDRSTFWLAEDYHQDYYLKNPLRYKYYRTACGRDARVKKVWGKAKAQ